MMMVKAGKTEHVKRLEHDAEVREACWEQASHLCLLIVEQDGIEQHTLLQAASRRMLEWLEKEQLVWSTGEPVKVEDPDVAGFLEDAVEDAFLMVESEPVYGLYFGGGG